MKLSVTASRHIVMQFPGRIHAPTNCVWPTRIVLILFALTFVAQGNAHNIVPVQQTFPTHALPTANRKSLSVSHRFWDHENDLLFAGMAASRVLDFSSTIHNRHRGLDEELLNNEIVDNHARFFGIEAGTAAASIGLSYLFHRTGHHRLERWVSIVHIGVAAAGAVRNYSEQSPQPE